LEEEWMAMSAAPGPEKAPARRSYAKPAMKRVILKPEEAVLGACKIAGKFGPTAGDCKPVGNCSGIGS
jgi:hypothetical protein